MSEAAVKYPVPASDVGRPCRACGKQLHFVKTPAGKTMPVEWDGTPHWGNCTRPDLFKTRKTDDDRKEERDARRDGPEGA